MHSSKWFLAGVLLLWAQIASAAVTFAEFDTGKSNVDQTSYTTATLTPTASTLYLLAVANTHATDATLPTASGQGQTWVQVGTRLSSNTDSRTTVFCAIGGSTNGAVTIDFGGTTQTGAAWKITAITGMTSNCTIGSGGIVQVIEAGGGSATTSTATLAALGSATNGEIAFCASQVNSTFTAEWTEQGAEEAQGTAALTLGAHYQAATDTTSLCTFGSAGQITHVALEIDEAAGASTSLPGILGGNFGRGVL